MQLVEGVRKRLQPDNAVSPVIATILMVAITVVLAATVYVWVSGFNNQDQGPENVALSTSSMDADRNGASDWIRVTLTRGENAPYSNTIVSAQVIHGSTVLSSANDWLLCTSPSGTTLGGNQICTAASQFDGSDVWAVGASLFIPCQGEGQHTITVGLAGSTVLDTTVRCDGIP